MIHDSGSELIVALDSCAAPTITANTLRLETGSPGNNIVGNNTLGELIFFKGKNFPATSSHVRVTYGPVGNEDKSVCSVQLKPGVNPLTEIGCTTQQGLDASLSVKFQSS